MRLVLILALLVLGGCSAKPLERKTNDILLSNGATLRIEAVEQRGFRSDGWSVTASYMPAGSNDLEMIGWWEGYNHDPIIHIVDNLVVLPSPDLHTLYVRSADGKWRFFSMQFPDERSSLPIQHYTTLTTLTEDELHSVRQDIEPDEKEWAPAIYLKSFDPTTKEVYVLYQTNPETRRHIYLKLSDDGTDLSLVRIKKETANNALQAIGAKARLQPEP